MIYDPTSGNLVVGEVAYGLSARREAVGGFPLFDYGRRSIQEATSYGWPSGFPLRRRPEHLSEENQ